MVIPSLPHQASNIPPNFRCHKHIHLSFYTTNLPNIRRPLTVDCGMVDFLGRDRRSNLARSSRFGQGIKSPCWLNFALKMYPIKQSRRSIARRNPTLPEHQDVEYGVEVGWTRRICFIAPRGFVGGHGRMRKQSMYHDVKNEFSTMISSCRWMWGHSQ